ncbi:hypothetical protein V6N13_141035 [Hibiscus sabdariffa]
MDRNRAAIKIQAAFRAHPAKKALRALRGPVKLQAIIRDEVVRRQAMKNTKCLQSGTKMYPDIKEKAFLQTPGEIRASYTKMSCRPRTLSNPNLCIGAQLLTFCRGQHNDYSRKSWNDSVVSKEDVDAMSLRRKEAMAKRESSRRR